MVDIIDVFKFLEWYEILLDVNFRLVWQVNKMVQEEWDSLLVLYIVCLVF